MTGEAPDQLIEAWGLMMVLGQGSVVGAKVASSCRRSTMATLRPAFCR